MLKGRQKEKRENRSPAALAPEVAARDMFVPFASAPPGPALSARVNLVGLLVGLESRL